jgi:hypothetical protein
MTLQSQISQNRAAIQLLVDQAKKIGGFTPNVNNNALDKIPIEKTSNNQRHYVTLNDIVQFVLNNLPSTAQYVIAVTVNGSQFVLNKKKTNNNPLNIAIIEIGDTINGGWWSGTKYIMEAIYLGGDIDTLSSWDVINSYSV